MGADGANEPQVLVVEHRPVRLGVKAQRAPELTALGAQCGDHLLVAAIGHAGDHPLRIWELIVPGGLEELFRSLGDSYDPETLPAMARQYGCDVDFERTMPLVEQHGLIF